MNNITKLSLRWYLALTLIVMLFVTNACKKQEYTLATTDDVNITGYLDKYPEKFSMFSEVIERSGSAGFLGAYGSYTLFTPTNEAVKAWLQLMNKSAVSELSAEELKKVVQYHLVMDTLNTKNFSDGKLQSLPLYGQYITTGVANINGVSTYILNKNARIIQSNIRVGNGVLQVIDNVLIPQTKTIAQLIDERSDRYKIFKRALVETGFYDLLNVDPLSNPVKSQRFKTIFLQSDSALAVSKIFDYSDLAKLSQTGDPKNHSDSLWLYVAYHISPNANYLADVIDASTLTTFAPLEVITTTYANQKIILNEIEFNGLTEEGVELNRTYSDIAASNGVIHDAKNNFNLVVRVPTPLYWDMTLDGIAQNPRHPNYGIKDIELHPGGVWASPSYRNADSSKAIQSKYRWTDPSNRYFNRRDILAISLVGPTNTTGTLRPLWHQFQTPLLVKGLYKVWVCYGQQGTSGNTNGVRWTMNPGTEYEQNFTNPFYCGNGLNNSGVFSATNTSDNLMEAQGFKRYMAVTTETATDANGNLIRGDVPTNNTTPTGRLIGIANIRTTNRQWIRCTGVGGMAGSEILWLDMIHFIPIDMDQQYPRFSKSGVVFSRP